MAAKTMYLYGKNSVIERLRVSPRSIHRVFLQENVEAEQIAALVKNAHIPITSVSEKQLYRIKRADRLQGVVAEIDAFSYASFEDLVDDPPQKNFSFIFLDSLNDPHNLGSIIRIAACFGGFAVVIPRRNCCEVNETVLHVASGGENFVPVCMVHNISQALQKAKRSDYWIVGTVMKNGDNLHSARLPFPLCLVLGSEGEGVRQGVEKLFDLRLTLPMRGAALSFNVAMANAIFCYEIDKQRAQQLK
ncbi:MAG: 23S rRNA (guanosine(2251)-2'-O)-methyltransferase RlmB [Candidatus Omnitrophota bacterium]